MWDLPRPGLEPVSPALAGRLSTTAPPGKPDLISLHHDFLNYKIAVKTVQKSHSHLEGKIDDMCKELRSLTGK